MSSIIINPQLDIQFDELLKKIGFSSLKKIEDQPYDVAIYPNSNNIFIGTYKNSLIISIANLPTEFFNSSLSDFELKLIDVFPNSEICAVSLNSVINHWGYAIIKNGKKIRARTGDSDSGTTLDFGEPMQEELELLSKSKIDKNGTRRYYFDKNADEPYNEDQVGENFVFEIFKRYTGELLNADDEIMETQFVGYEIAASDFNLTFDTFFSDQWVGSYSLGNGYRDSIKEKKEFFYIDMNVSDGVLIGTCTDDNKKSDNPAKITGLIVDIFIGFKKEYPFEYFIDEKGITHKEVSNPSNNVAYSGLYDPLTDSFKGIWRIENKQLWGDWSMKRKTI